VIEFTGNTSSATIPLTLAEAERNGALQPGQIVLMTGFGAGMAWGTAVVRW
jgi:3-oxoacyl-[acyl-carrier-protein] synthase-3